MDNQFTPNQTPLAAPTHNKPSPWILVSGVLALTTILGGIASYYFWNTQSTPIVQDYLPTSSPLSIVTPIPTVIPTNTPESTMDPSLTVLSKVGLTVKIPTELFYYEPLVEVEWQQPEVQGTNYCMTFSRTKNKDRVPLCGDNDIIGNAVSINYDAGREIGFLDFQGYSRKDDVIILKMFTKEIEAPVNQIKEITNANGVKVLKVVPDPQQSEEEVMTYWPRTGYIGAIINTKSTTYPGFVLLAKIDGGISEAAFDTFLQSIAYQ